MLARTNRAGTHHAHAAARLHARVDDAPVVLRLLLERRRVGRSAEVDVELGDCDVQAQVRKALQVLLEVGWDLAEGEVALEADGVDGDAVLDEALYDIVEGVGLGVDVLDAVVVNAAAWSV